MLKTNPILFSRPWLAGIALGLAFLAAGGCGTGDSAGLCKPAKNSGYVAATDDPWGKEWTLDLTPTTYTVKCAAGSDEGEFEVMAVIKNSSKTAQAGIVINATMGTITNSVLEIKQADINTDSCGAAFFRIHWKCPTNAGEQRASTLIVFSGALRNSMDITVEHYMPPTSALWLK